MFKNRIILALIATFLAWGITASLFALSREGIVIVKCSLLALCGPFVFLILPDGSAPWYAYLNISLLAVVLLAGIVFCFSKPKPWRAILGFALIMGWFFIALLHIEIGGDG